MKNWRNFSVHGRSAKHANAWDLRRKNLRAVSGSICAAWRIGRKGAPFPKALRAPICGSSSATPRRCWTRSKTEGIGTLLLLMLLQARHQLDEIARAEAVVELVHEDAFPGVAAGAGRTGQCEQIGAAGDPGGGAALDRRGADLLVALPAEQLAETCNLLFVDAVECFRGYVAAGDPGA